MKTRLAISISVLLATTACDEKKDTAAAATATPPAKGADKAADKGADKPAADAPKEGAAAAPAAAKFKGNAEVLELLKKIVAGCTVSVDSPAVYSCKDKEDRNLEKYIDDNKPKDLFATWVELLGDSDLKLRAAAVAEANNTLFIIDNDLRKANATKDVATGFLNALAKNDDYAIQLAQPTVAMAFDAGLKDEVIKITDGLKPEARNRAYQRFLQYGRLDGLPKLKEVAAQKEFASSALLAPRYMLDWTDAEKAEICPWAKGFLANEEAHAAAEAGYTMIACKGEFAEALLAEGEKRLKAKQLEYPFADTLNQVCQALTFTPEVETNPICKKDYALLEKIVKESKLKPETRASALWGIFSQRRDKECLAVMKKYKKDKVPEIAKKATEAIDALAQNNIK